MDIQFPTALRISVLAASAAAILFCVGAPAQDAKPDAAKTDVKGLAPRASAGDYQARGQAGMVSIGAEFTEHSVALPDATYSNEDYVTVEMGLFGAAGTPLNVSLQNFTLKINGKKMPQPAQEFAAVFHNLKDPLYVSPDELAFKKAKAEGGGGNGLSTGGGGGQQSDQGNLPPVIHIPIGVERAMQQKVRQAALPEGERPLPVAGLIFFEHRGRVNSAELTYNGPAGKATIRLQ